MELVVGFWLLVIGLQNNSPDLLFIIQNLPFTPFQHKKIYRFEQEKELSPWPACNFEKHRHGEIYFSKGCPLTVLFPNKYQ